MRIKESDLKAKVTWLNKMAGFEDPEYSTIGAYCLSFAYGGVALHRYCNEHGGVHDVFNRGHMPKRELYDMIHAYESGVSDAVQSYHRIKSR